MSVQIQGGRRQRINKVHERLYNISFDSCQTNFRPYSRAASVAKRFDDSTEQKRTRGGFSTDDSKVLQVFFLAVKMKEN